MDVPAMTRVRLRITEIRAAATSHRTFVIAVELNERRLEHEPYVHPTVRPPISEPHR